MAQAVPNLCPICKKPMDVKFRPFCSARCADIDLGGWLLEKYTIPAETEDQEPDN